MAAITSTSALDPHLILENWANQAQALLKLERTADESAETYNGRKWILLKNLFERITKIPFKPTDFEESFAFWELMACKIRVFLQDNNAIWSRTQDLIHLQTLKNTLSNCPISDKEFIKSCINQIDSISQSLLYSSYTLKSTRSLRSIPSSSSFESRVIPISAEINGYIPTPGGVSRSYFSDDLKELENKVLKIFLLTGVAYIDIRKARVVGAMINFDMNQLLITELAELAAKGFADDIEYFAKELVLHRGASTFKDAIKIFMQQVISNSHMSSDYAIQLLVYEVYYIGSHSNFLWFLQELLKECRMNLPDSVIQLERALKRSKTDENLLSFIEFYFAHDKKIYSPILIARMFRDFVAKDIPRSSVICPVEDTDIAQEKGLSKLKGFFPREWEKDPVSKLIVQEMTRFGTRWIWRFLLNIANLSLDEGMMSNRLNKLVPLDVRVIDELTPNACPGGSCDFSFMMRLVSERRESLLHLLLTGHNLEAVALRGGSSDLSSLHAKLLALSRNPNVCNIRELHIFGDSSSSKSEWLTNQYEITSDQLQATLCSSTFKHLKHLFICNPSNELINSFSENLPFQLDKLTLFFAPKNSIFLDPILPRFPHASFIDALVDSSLLDSVRILRIGYLNMDAEDLLPLIDNPDLKHLQEITLIGNTIGRLKKLPNIPTYFNVETQTTQCLGWPAQLVKLNSDSVPPKKLVRSIRTIFSDFLTSSFYHLWMRFGPSCG